MWILSVYVEQQKREKLEYICLNCMHNQLKSENITEIEIKAPPLNWKKMKLKNYLYNWNITGTGSLQHLAQ